MTPEETYRDYFAAIRAGDRRRALDAADHAFRGGLDLATIYLRVFQPALRRIGELWEEGEINVAEEHLATEITETAMARLADRVVEPAPDPAATVLAAGAEDERHVVGLRMVADLLECEGWNVSYLGGTVPRDSLVAMVVERRPAVLALSATMRRHVEHLAAAIRGIRRELGAAAPIIIVGGRPFRADPGLARRIGADLEAADAADASRRLRPPPR